MKEKNDDDNNNNENNDNNNNNNNNKVGILKSLELTGINNKILSFIKKTMNFWKASMCLYMEWKPTETLDTEIRCGLFHRDSLPPQLICITLISFTEQLNKLNTGYEHTNKDKSITLLYLENLKTEEELQKQMQS